MSSYNIRLPDSRVVEVSMPKRLKIEPGTDEGARAAVMRYITEHTAAALEPIIKPRPPWKEVVRDANGRIDKVIDHPADPPAAETAAELAQQAAELYVSEIDWS